MLVDRFLWVGLTIVGVGWVALIADMTVSESMLRAGNLVAVISLRSDIVTLAQTTVLSGFGLAVIGALRSGFGTLNRFFEGVVSRSTAPARAPAAPIDDFPEPYAPMVMQTPMPPAPIVASVPATLDRVAATGQIRDSNYVILSDGSVEVETLLGTRIFASLDEARDFIR